MQPLQANSQVIYIHPEDSLSSCGKRVLEIALQLLIPFGLTWAAFMLFPVIFVPFVTVGSVAATALTFASLQKKPELVPPPPREATRGIERLGANCWVNSLAQILRCDRGIMDWFRNAPDLFDLGILLLLPEHVVFLPEGAPVPLPQDFVPFCNPALHPQLCVRAAEKIAEIQAMAPEARQNLLCYFRVLSNIDAGLRIASAHIINKFQAFYENYDAAVEANLRVMTADSQTLREAFHAIAPRISANPLDCQDPTEAFAVVIRDLLPPELKVRLQNRRVLGEEGLPPILNRQEVVIQDEEPSMGYVPLAIQGDHPRLEDLLQWNRRSSGGTRVRRMGVDNQIHEYMIMAEERRFVRPPASLWIQLHRLQYGVKIETAVQVPDQLEEQPIEGSALPYQLDGFLVHQGTAAGGHYVSYTRAANGDWYESDDTIVRKIEGDELKAAREQAYFIHYSRI